MKLCALLCWFDEPVDWLAGCVASLAKAKVDHVVAVDGAYFMLPGALRTPVSPGDQAAVIAETARNSGIGATVHVPNGPWLDNEVEKRSFSFELGRVTGADWFLVIDADELVLSAPFDLAQVLAETEEDVSNVKLVERGDLGGASPSPRLFRNTPGLRLEGAHWRYVSHRAAVGLGTQDYPAGMCLDLVLEHRRRNRHSQRRQDQLAYYDLRDELGFEKQHLVAAVT